MMSRNRGRDKRLHDFRTMKECILDIAKKRLQLGWLRRLNIDKLKVRLKTLLN